LELELALELE
jgi:hypothetical protein